MIVATAWAEEPPADAPEWSPSAALRVVETVPTAFVVDGDGRTTGWGPALDTRLRTGLGWARGDVRAHAELDLFSGQLLGDTWALPALDQRDRDRYRARTLDGVVPRALAVGGRFPWFDLEAGLTVAPWGLGMVANDGAADPLFGRSDFGDRTLRVRLATAPIRRGAFPLYVVLAGDRVVSDDLATWRPFADDGGDRALQAIAALLYAPAEDRRMGVYGVVRDQRAPDGDRLRAYVLDGYEDWTWRSGDGVRARVAAEGAALFGHTDAARAYTSPDGLRIRQGGLALRTELGTDLVTGHFRLAYASGDATTDDDRVTDFRFDRDYDVGMVLFDEIASAQALAAYRLASDPARGEVPTAGLDTLADEGAFHGAVALQPIVQVRPLDWLEVRAGGVFAWSTGPLANPYATFLNGGVPSNLDGTPTTSSRIGEELDYAVVLGAPAPASGPSGSVAVQVGHAWPTVDFAGPIGRVDEVLVFGRLGWR